MSRGLSIGSPATPGGGYGTTVLEHARFDEFDGFFDDPEEDYGDGNPRCLWDGSVCSESVTHQIRFRFFPEDDEPFVETESYCARHYAVTLARFVSFHSPHCPVTLAQHLDSFGPHTG